MAVAKKVKKVKAARAVPAGITGWAAPRKAKPAPLAVLATCSGGSVAVEQLPDGGIDLKRASGRGNGIVLRFTRDEAIDLFDRLGELVAAPRGPGSIRRESSAQS